MADGEIVGAVTAGVLSDATLYMFWSYISRQYSVEEAVPLLKCLLAHRFKAARDRGLSKAEAEVDTTDSVSSSLLNWFLICSDKVWRILQQPRTPPNHSGASDC